MFHKNDEIFHKNGAMFDRGGALSQQNDENFYCDGRILLLFKGCRKSFEILVKRKVGKTQNIVLQHLSS